MENNLILNIPQLCKLDEILNLLRKSTNNEKIIKRWLTVKESSEYIGYSVNSIHKMVQKGIFVLNYHYYKKEKKLIFDSNMLDIWITNSDSLETTKNIQIVDKIISSTITN